MRADERKTNQIRPLSFRRKFTRNAPGSVLVQMGRTTVLCTCCVDSRVPEFLEGQNKGWLTAEYGMLPSSTATRKPRDRSKTDGRTMEIQRLIGRSLRAVLDLEALGPRTLWIDCDVLEADGGTRTASINGAFIAVIDALHALRKELPHTLDRIVKDSVAAVSVGIVDGEERLDLDYEEDSGAEVDFNLVMTGTGQFVEVQGSGEEATFSREQLDKLIKLGESGIRAITAEQKKALGALWLWK
ncbi:MAG: ribonuclease PH [Gemmataceae bacterium]|nr:ribonuclease PH [Gemmataceae bacterium]